MLLTDVVMGWKSSQQTHSAKILTGHVVPIKPFQDVKIVITQLKRVRRLHLGN